MADSDVRDSEMSGDSEPEWKNWLAAIMDKMASDLKQEMSELKQEMSVINEIKRETIAKMDKTLSDMRKARIEARQEYRATLVRHDKTEEVMEEREAVKQQCEGRTGVAESVVDGRPCPKVVDAGAAKTVVGEEVVAVQDLPVADRQLCGVTGHCTTVRGPVMSTITVGGVEKLLAFVADMEEPCLVGLDSLVQSAACVDSGRMQMQVCEEMLSLILEDAAEHVESPVTSSDVEDERLELRCRVVREGEVADATVRGHECQAAVRSCGGEVADATVRGHECQVAVRSCGGEVADATGTTRGWQAAPSNDGGEVDGDAGEVSPVLSPHVVDWEVCSFTKQTPEQVVKLEKRLMEHENVFRRDAQDLGCTSLVQPSNTVCSPLMKQPHFSVLLARREEMRLPLDLATGRPPEEELQQTAHEVVVILQQQMEATWRRVVNNRCLAGQTMTRRYQLHVGDAQNAVWDRGWRYKPRRKRGWRITGNVERPYTAPQRLAAVAYKLTLP
ncbi:hypothetical protein E2C01_057723 [Portunus trituberculatus]|uniref:Uncharacterized protein n=1 Tax=Portunus trituberculatus TaxID=210409 RepID=A0A5B7H0S8_PORTR|nr:hypothetical protein [Portunus trituberculatus]